MVVEGKNDGYPNYDSAIIHFISEDPATVEFKNLFICSPLFSIKSEGAVIPTVEDGTNITFLIMPNVFPSLNKILSTFSFQNELWFTLGLANVVIIEKDSNKLSDAIIEYLVASNNLIAYERWAINSRCICKVKKPTTTFTHKNTSIEHINIGISDKLPLHLKFTFSEYIISVDKFLTASKKFTPQYYEKHKRTVSAGNDLLIDISFLYGDETFDPTDSTLNIFQCDRKEDLLAILGSEEAANKIELLINDKYSRLVQFNSSMSYVYSQAYAGTFPIFDHIGIVRRHSLLGIGTAISALFELLTQIEEALFLLPFEDVEDSEYNTEVISSTDYFSLFSDPGSFNPEIWSSSSSSRKAAEKRELPDDFYYRLAFFSGRLGFREYDLSATSAIQVLVEAYSLQWNVINYTHEIIHNHVRTILNSILKGPLSVHNEYLEWLKAQLQTLKDIHSSTFRAASQKMLFKDYFVSVILNFCVNARYFGSISKESNYEHIRKKRVNPVDYTMPDELVVKALIIELYRDINEIFVHVIDFTYIYARDTRTYVMSIWTSWITVSAVINDFKQYVLRTLLVISLGIKGESKYRYDEAKKHFVGYLEEIKGSNFSDSIFRNILLILEDKDDDLLYRFFNCIVLADLVNNFFIGNLELILDKEDDNCLPKGTEDTDGNVRIYDLETNSFKSSEIKSKVRFLLDQLIRAIKDERLIDTDGKKEQTSAWLLLSLSSNNES